MGLLRATAACGARGASIDDYLDATELSRPTIYRLLKGLREEGFLRPSPVRHRYLLGYELLALGAEAGNGANLRDLARPRLLTLAQQLGDSFYLFAHDGRHAVCLEVQNGAYPVGSFVASIGGRVLLGAGQASIALLASLAKSERDWILAANRDELASRYDIEIDAVEAEIERCVEQGYARGVEGSSLPEFTGLALPLLDHSGRCLGAMTCSMLKSRMTPEHRRDVLAGMAEQIEDLVTQAHGLLRADT
ncbi:IclR family transcriptional regulator [Salinicola aestuarinus]|uniref:IclR family transcriptional regulator n=1 Tax=Salinicola aestuarinus TaxID=1949082 RepID=UPI000DA1484D|nr:IclR family transcriptional regulator C-terminal domain-containing protein [Salinicola aestuarinus]